MPSFTICVTRDIAEQCVMVVEADNLEEAKDEAIAISDSDDAPEWITTDWCGASQAHQIPDQINLGLCRHNATDAVQCLVEDFESYLSGEVDPDRESHQCSLDNALMLQHLLDDVRSLGSAIEEGDVQTISTRWLSLKRGVEL